MGGPHLRIVLRPPDEVRDPQGALTPFVDFSQKPVRKPVGEGGDIRVRDRFAVGLRQRRRPLRVFLCETPDLRLDVPCGRIDLDARTRKGRRDFGSVLGRNFVKSKFEGVDNRPVQPRALQLKHRFSRAEAQDDTGLPPVTDELLEAGE